MRRRSFFCGVVTLLPLLLAAPALGAAGYAPAFREERLLPNGKQLLRLDYAMENPI